MAGKTILPLSTAPPAALSARSACTGHGTGQPLSPANQPLKSAMSARDMGRGLMPEAVGRVLEYLFDTPAYRHRRARRENARSAAL